MVWNYLLKCKLRTFNLTCAHKLQSRCLTSSSTCILVVLACSVLSSGFCYDEAARLYGVSPDLLRAISYVESGYSPSAINMNPNGTYDYGLMQINTCWYDSLGPMRWRQLGDPCFNTMAGAWILRQCQNRYGSKTWDYVSCYNTGLPLSKTSKGLDYVLKVRKALYGEGRHEKSR